jgi:hypothetical protein
MSAAPPRRNAYRLGITIPVGVLLRQRAQRRGDRRQSRREATIAAFTGDTRCRARRPRRRLGGHPEIAVTTQVGTDPASASTTTYRNLPPRERRRWHRRHRGGRKHQATGAMGFAMQFGEMSLTEFDMAGCSPSTASALSRHRLDR